MARIRWKSDTRAYSAPLGAVLLLLLVIAGALTWEAWSAASMHRAAAEDALEDYAQFAALNYSTTATNRFWNSATVIFGPVGGAAAGAPRAAVFSPRVLEEARQAAHDCECVWDPYPLYYFAYRIRDSTLTVAGDSLPDAARRARLIDSLTANFDTMGAAPPGARRWNLFATVEQYRNRTHLVLMTYQRGVRGVPDMVYGFDAPFEPYVDHVLPSLIHGPAGAALLPKALTRGLPGDSLLAVRVRQPGGRVLYQSEPTLDTAYSAEVPLWNFMPDGPMVRLAIRPAAAEKLLNGGVPRSRVPLLTALLMLAGVLVLVALVLSQRAQELAELRADFTSSVSHELRTPLAQILLFAETLHLKRANTERERENAMRVILREARRLAHLVDNVLLFSRTEHRASQLSAFPLPLAPLVRDIVESFAPLARTREVALETALEERIVAPVDAGAVRQMLLNLLDNALKYGPQGQTITVTLSTDGCDARIAVDDQGPGVRPADRERIWEAFVRGARNEDSPSTGSGIGLAVVRRLATMHGGRCWVGTAPGGGARFVIELPGAEESEQAELASRRARPWSTDEYRVPSDITRAAGD